MLETQRKLIKFSNYSFCLTLPKSAIDQLGWGKGDEVTVVFDETKQVITISKSSSTNLQTKTIQNQPDQKQVNTTPVTPKLRW